jgi:nucleoside-diphosphate-sugar epimerase
VTRRRDQPDITIVTGATGWFGRALLAALTGAADPRRRDGEIRALVTSAAEAEQLAALPGVRAVLGDVRSAPGLARLYHELSGTVDVIHAAGVIHPAAPSDFVEVNTRGTMNVAAASRAAGVRRLVHISSNSPFGANSHRGDVFRNDEPYNPYLGYGRSKMLAELRLLDEVERGLDAVIVRPPWFYGPRQPARQTRFLSMVRTGRFPVLGDGRQRRSMVHVDNLVDGVLAAELVATPPGRAWWIADSRPYEINEVVAAVTVALSDAGFPVARRQMRVPAWCGRAAARADRALQAAGRYVAPLHVLGELGATIACDVGVATDELGYEPRVSLVDGMRASVAWCLERGIPL